MERFPLLINDLGEIVNVPLQVDSHGVCLLVVNNQLHVQLQEKKESNQLLVGSFVSEVPPGNFRETIFKGALKENNDLSRLSVFGYSQKKNQLFLFAYLLFVGLDGDSLAVFLEKFLEKAFSWKMGIETGQLPLKGQVFQKTGPSIFDIKKT
jgi:hypothetical protein